MFNKLLNKIFKTNKYSREVLEQAGIHAGKHKVEILKSEYCACYYCQRTFLPSKIETWVDEENTALCPKCGIDAVIGSASGLPINDHRYLKEAHAFYF